MKINFGSKSLEINLSGDHYLAVMDGETVLVEVVRVDVAQGRMDLRFTELSESGSTREPISKSVYVSSDMAKRWVTADGHTIMLTKTSGAKQGVRHDHAGGLIAPMPGQVRSVSVSVGDVVKKGQTLLTMEAMKMEIRIQALKDGRVTALHAAQGQTVEREQILIEVEE